MGDFTEVLAAIPEFTGPARKEIYVGANGMEIAVVTPLDGGPAIFRSSIPMHSTQGPMTMQFPIPASTIEQAVAGWQDAARAAVREIGEKMKENQRRIVVPGSPAANTAPFKSLN